ncbi:MAG: D-2-hydroxyacid dehydrogenase family protein [Rhodospirillales bacterium]|nr:D-2-hydroxyacid dehydrogenase family protein [Rhodospirillales bacterium]
MTRVAILDDYQNAALTAADWHSLHDTKVTVFTEYMDNEDTVAEALQPFDVIVGMRERTPFPKSLIDRLPNLKLLITTGMLNRSFDMDAARARGITVCGTRMPGVSAYELAWAIIMALSKKLVEENRAMHEGRWQEGIGFELKGKTLGILGLGNRGIEMARLGNAFGMKVIAWSQNLTDERATEHGATRVDKDDLFRQSDILTIQLVLGDRTRGIVGVRELGLMKPTAYLVNTSRGPIVDEKALIQALKEKKIAGAGLDVYDVEPLPADHPLRGLDNALLTGHTGYVVEELFTVTYGDAVENIQGWLDGKPVRVLNDK